MSGEIKLEVLSYLPITYRQCMHCESVYDRSGIGGKVHDQILNEYPTAVLDEQEKLLALVVELNSRYRNKIKINIIELLSIGGLISSLRFRVSRYPAFIINGKEKVLGWNHHALCSAIDAYLVD